MKAAVIDEYGPADVLRVREVPRPAPRPDQILIEVHASSVNPIDWKIRGGALSLLTGRSFPMILGYDVSGRVVEAGAAVARFRVGDLVYARSDSKTGRAYAQYVAVGEGAAALKPKNASHEEAAAVPLAALTSFQALRDLGRIEKGGRVLVIGASGGVGVYAVQIAKALGAHVTAVCGTDNVALVRDLGADVVIDYRKESGLGASDSYDIIFDAVASQGFFAVR
ncbi:MAG: NAD(P)-dependent alcohol dehydrogenase, partial [Elusimicrobia bacterium]|nr:NAD(P)-dependent alcohol dehydrogenase [Elusimicrobiota bacterium]